MTTQPSDNNKRIAKNTLILYVRMLFTVGISFYSTRLILANLGVENYGIYNVIGGFVSMFYMVTATMTQAVSRFLTFDLGRGNIAKLQKTFSTSVNILLLMSFVVVLLAETVGLWFVNNKLNIDDSRMLAANWIYQFSVFSFVLEMISVPYGASVISHEKMGTFAFVTIAKVLLTLGIAFVLTISPIDRLVFYGLLVFLVGLAIQAMYWVYCRKNFEECRYSVRIEKDIFKDMFGFAGWNFLTTCACMLSSQGVNILLNMHFGAFINAASGVASQINSTVGAFSRNFTKAISPQITKQYSLENYDYAKSLVCKGAKFSFLAFFFIALPCMLEINFILSVWLKEVPPYAGIFVQLVMLNSLVEILVNTSEVLNAATGKIRNYQIIVSSVQIGIVLFSYLAISITDNPILTMAVSNVLYLFVFIPRILSNKPYIGITLKYFYENVLRGLTLMVILTILLSTVPMVLMSEGWERLITVGFVSTASIVVTAYIFVLSKGEKEKILHVLKGRMLMMKH